MGTFIHQEYHNSTLSNYRRVGSLGKHLVQVHFEQVNGEAPVYESFASNCGDPQSASRAVQEAVQADRHSFASTSLRVDIELPPGMRITAARKLNSETLKLINSSFDAEGSKVTKPIFRALEENWDPSVFVCVPFWRAWSQNWQWRQELKVEIEKRPHAYQDELLVVALDQGSHLQLIRWGGGGSVGAQWFTAISDESQELLQPEIMETAVKLWEPLKNDSPYKDLNDTFKAAKALLR